MDVRFQYATESSTHGHTLNGSLNSILPMIFNHNLSFLNSHLRQFHKNENEELEIPKDG